MALPPKVRVFYSFVCPFEGRSSVQYRIWTYKHAWVAAVVRSVKQKRQNCVSRSIESRPICPRDESGPPTLKRCTLELICIAMRTYPLLDLVKSLSIEIHICNKVHSVPYHQVQMYLESFTFLECYSILNLSWYCKQRNCLRQTHLITCCLASCYSCKHLRHWIPNILDL